MIFKEQEVEGRDGRGCMPGILEKQNYLRIMFQASHAISVGTWLGCNYILNYKLNLVYSFYDLF